MSLIVLRHKLTQSRFVCINDNKKIKSLGETFLIEPLEDMFLADWTHPTFKEETAPPRRDGRTLLQKRYNSSPSLTSGPNLEYAVSPDCWSVGSTRSSSVHPFFRRGRLAPPQRKIHHNEKSKVSRKILWVDSKNLESIVKLYKALYSKFNFQLCFDSKL